MKKEIRLALIIAIGFISLLWIEKPLKELFMNFIADELIMKFVASITLRLSLLCIAIYLIFRLNLNKFSGLHSKMKTKNLHATLIALVIIIFGILNSWEIYLNIELTKLILFAISAIAVGFFEEFVFRGTVLPLFIKSFKEKKQVLIISVILSSFIFGIIHYINLIREPDNIVGITSQVFFAFSMGVFFGGLLLRTENIIVPSIIHGLVNFSFSAGDLIPEKLGSISEKVTNGPNWNSIIPTTIFLLFILISGLYMIKKSSVEGILSKLS